MADYQGNNTKKPEECKKDRISRCANMKEVGGGFSGERYHCEVCGASYYLDYEDMK